MSDMVNYGIDLGTTNSAIAKYEGDAVRVFKSRDQMDVTPSVVRLEKSGRIIVGKRAYNTLFSDPDNVAAEFKRWMGQSDRKNFLAVGKLLSAEDLSAEVLKSLIEDARRQTTDTINAAVITVPAAFGQLQCEATARAASLAGLKQAHLLQEPLAAAIAYGMKPEATDKRWLVYDLGGGTFDIAVVSTRNGQLSVLEHKGDNMLGGKDFDRLIVENIFWSRLEESFNLPQPNSDPVARKKLMQFLRGKAEEVKIDLSLSERVEISIFDIGTDRDGNAIELEFELERAEMNQLVEPFIAKTIELCKEALAGARLSNKEVAAVMLVGGPTHMPIVREMITNELGVKLDYSIDPMTVVARGAAIYASTLPHKQESTITTKPGSISINLAHEAVWAETTCLVAGSIETLPPSVRSLQILIEAEAGHWNSGWLSLKNGYFETNVHLLEGKTTRFWIYLRDEKGNDFTPTPDSFSIRHGLSLTEPPLPHAIGAEVVRLDGRSEIDIIFHRSTSLPAEKRVTYKASKALKPSQSHDYLAIKVWEIEEGRTTTDPEANTIVGALKIHSEAIRRPIPEGAEIELAISIDASRKMEVEAFVPVINQHFRGVYVAQDNYPTMIKNAKALQSELNEHYERIAKLEEATQEIDNPAIQQEVHELKEELENLAVEQNNLERESQIDPDDAKRVVQQYKSIRGRLGEIEKQVESWGKMPLLLRKVDSEKSATEEVVKKWGQALEHKEFDVLCRSIDRLVEREDEKGIGKVIQDLGNLKLRILTKQPWFWKEFFDDLCDPDAIFVNTQEAYRLIASGKEALARGDGETLENVVFELWKLQPKNIGEIEKEKALKAGIRKH